MRRKAKPFICFWLSDVVFLSSSLESFNPKLSPGRCWRQTLFFFLSFFFFFFFFFLVPYIHCFMSCQVFGTLLFCWHKTGRRRLHVVCRRAPQNGQKDNNGTTSAIVLQEPRHHKTDKRTTNEAPQSGQEDNK